MTLTPEERGLAGQLAANTSWARTADRTARTAAARRAFRDKFEREVPPEITDPVTRAKAAENARSAYYQRIAFASSKARRQAAAHNRGERIS